MTTSMDINTSEISLRLIVSRERREVFLDTALRDIIEYGTVLIVASDTETGCCATWTSVLGDQSAHKSSSMH